MKMTSKGTSSGRTVPVLSSSVDVISVKIPSVNMIV